MFFFWGGGVGYGKRVTNLEFGESHPIMALRFRFNPEWKGSKITQEKHVTIFRLAH